MRTLLREQMRGLKYADARGEAPVMYLDAADDDLPGALLPNVRYEISGDSISIRIRMILNEKSVAEQTVSGSASNTNALAAMLAARIVDMAVAIQKWAFDRPATRVTTKEISMTGEVKGLTRCQALHLRSKRLSLLY